MLQILYHPHSTVAPGWCSGKNQYCSAAAAQTFVVFSLEVLCENLGIL